MNELLSTTIENLPPLPETVVKLQNYIDQSGSEVQTQKVADIIVQDPLLTADLLRLANSPYYGFSREISTINQVIALLGIDNVKNIVMADSLRSLIRVNVSPYGLDTDLFLGNCSKEVDFISNWLNEEDRKLAQTLVPCAMLLRLGMILFSSVLIKAKRDKEFREALKQNDFKNIALRTIFFSAS